MERALPLLPSNLKVGSLGSNCTGQKTWPSCPPCQQARWPADSLFPLISSLFTQRVVVWTDTPRKRRLRRSGVSVSSWLPASMGQSLCPDLAEAGDEVLRPRGCRFLPVPWLSLFQPLLYFLLTASTTRSRYFQFRGEEAESQSLGNLIKTHPTE